jgi:hypothetical protein
MTDDRREPGTEGNAHKFGLAIPRSTQFYGVLRYAE